MACHEGLILRGASEQDLGIFTDHKVGMNQLRDTVLAKIVSLHLTNRRTISRS